MHTAVYRHRRDTLAAGLLQQMRQPQPECALGEPAMGVDPQQAGSDVVQFRLGVGGYLAGLQGGDAAEQPPDTVGRAFVTPPPPGYRPPPVHGLR